MNDHIHWSSNTTEIQQRREQIEDLYKKGLESVKNFKLYGYTIDLNNPKEIIALLYILSEEFHSFHERF